MNPIFTIMCKDQKTYFIYSFDFKAGVFNGVNRSFTYDDVDYFIGVPSEIVRVMFETQPKSKKEDEVD